VIGKISLETQPSVGLCRAIVCLGALVAATAALPARGADAPAPTEAPALKFARHDVARWGERIQALQDSVNAAAARLDQATKAVAEAKGMQAAADKALADAGAALVAAGEAKSASAKAVVSALEALSRTQAEKKDDTAALGTAGMAVDAAARGVEAAIKELTLAGERKKQAELAKAEADKRIPELEAAIKPATEAKAAADKALADVQPQWTRAKERLASFEKAAPKADPTATRLVETITHDRPLLACRFDQSGEYVFAGAEDNCFHRWDLYTQSAVHPKVHKSWLGTLAVVPPEGAQVVTGGHEGKLSWWKGLDPNPPALRTIDAHKGYIRAVAVSPDGKLLASCGNDNLVKVWSMSDGSLVKALEGHTRHVYNVAFHPSGKFLVSGDLLGIVKQWDVGSFAAVRELDAKVLWKYDTSFQADVGGVRCFAFSGDGKYLAAGGIADVSNAFAGVGVPCVVLFDWETGKSLKVMKPKEAFQGSIFGVRFSPAGDFIVGAGGAGAGGLWFWKLDDDKSFHFVKLPSVAYDMDLHPDGLRIAVSLFDKTLRIYDLAPKFETAAAPAQPAAK
jgi:hypothetical protein